MNKITIIGTGSVGSTIAYTLTIANIAQEIALIDINGEKALGEAMDIRQGSPFTNPCNIYAGDYESARDSNIVIITSGIARKQGQSRLDLAQINVDIMKSIIPQITKYAPDAFYIIVSNPVDILTYQFCKMSGLPENKIIGSGTILDTSRLRSRLSEYFNISQQNIHAYVLGEHGDSSFIPWSVTKIASIPAELYRKSLERGGDLLPELNKDEVEDYVRKSGARVIARKGATFYAVSGAVCHICRCLLSGIDTMMTVSTMMHGEYGIDDVCLSTVNILGKNGVRSKVLLPLNDEEVGQLKNSATILKNLLKGLNY